MTDKIPKKRTCKLEEVSSASALPLHGGGKHALVSYIGILKIPEWLNRQALCEDCDIDSCQVRLQQVVVDVQGVATGCVGVEAVGVTTFSVLPTAV